jgi:hypothetical protein
MATQKGICRDLTPEPDTHKGCHYISPLKCSDIPCGCQVRVSGSGVSFGCLVHDEPGRIAQRAKLWYDRPERHERVFL